jgi:alpha-L-rhamnosidase
MTMGEEHDMPLRVTPVRFEHHRVALGIGEVMPRLSWIIEAAPAGWRQAGYEVQARGAGGEIDRVHVDSDESVLVPWPFAPLASRERREVRVRVIGVDGTQACSDWTRAEAGLVEPADWQAKMVGPTPGTPAGEARSPLIRGEFALPDGDVVRARLYATAHGLARFFLNGTRVGDDELTPGWTAYADRLRYRTYDVTDRILPGEHVIGAWLADGWWRGRIGWDGKDALYGPCLGVLAQLEVEYANGTRKVISSSTAWRAAPSAIDAADLYDGESFDARRYNPAWSAPGLDASGWAPTELHELDVATLVAPDGPPVRHTQTLAVREVLGSPSGKLIVDFGQNMVGRLRIRVSGAAGQTVTLRHAEVLQDGELATGPLRTAKATDRYTLAGEAPETWAPAFTVHGFRYAEITGWPGPFDPTDVVAEVLHSDLERTGTFEASDPRVNRLHENVVWSMRGNVVDLPTDCPQRDERLGWTGDLQVFAPTATYLYDSAGFLTSWLRDLAAEQRRLGVTPPIVPAVTSGATTPAAGWGDAAVTVPWVLYQRYGDIEVLRRQFPSMVAWLDQVAGITGSRRIWNSGFQYGDWLDPLAPPERPEESRTYPEIVATAYFAHSARIVAEVASLLGYHQEAARFLTLADEIRRAFHHEYVAASGRLLSDSATAYALALQFDLLDGENERRHAAGRLAAIVRDNRFRIPTGFLGTPLITEALSANGHADVAYRLLLQTEAPSWLYAVAMGATTIWERWDSLRPDGSLNPSGMTSFNHYAFGAVADWLHRVVAGLAPAAPGYRRIRVAPQPPRHGLTSASTALRTPYGVASTGWHIENDELFVTIVIPVGATADIVLPSGAEHLNLRHGTYRFVEPFEVEVAQRKPVTVDTPMGDLIADPEGLKVLMGVVVKHVPEAAEHMNAGLRGQDALTPRQIAAMLPHADDVLADLQRGFAAVSAGLPIPDDVLRATPATDDAEAVNAMAALLTGRDFWSTRDGGGIRSLVLTDGPHGVRRQKEIADHIGLHASLPATCFPTGSALASSWDPTLIGEVGAALGREAKALGVDVLLGPAINIKRSPLGGRNFEYLSEDPRLTGELAAAYVRGVQSTGVGTSVKHFAVNNQETDRMRVSAEVDERTLREIYLSAFERVVIQAEPTTVMSAYNAINGVFSSENQWLLTELLRGEWGFDGLVISDWGAIKDRVEALRAGVDLEMPGTGDEGPSELVRAVRDGRLDPAVIQRSVDRLRRLAERTASTQDDAELDLAAHHALARRAAAASVVLLRNENAVLPLRPGQRVAVVGELAVRPQFQGAGSSRVNPTRVDVPLDELRRALGEAVTYAPGYSRASTDSHALLATARATAAQVDVAVVFAGLYEEDQSEGFDREHLDLPHAQLALIDAVAAAAPHTVVVLCNGGVVSLEPWHDRVDAIVEAWALGQAVGSALADVLSGVVNPSGRLAETIPVMLADNPSYLNFPGENQVVRYGEGVFVGYRYYTSAGRAARYPFGHGLSYTTFDYRPPVIMATGPDTARVRVEVHNSGRRSGAEVVQVYVAPAPAPVRRPVRELGAFAKVQLDAGQHTVVEFELDRRAFAYWDTTAFRWRVQPGVYSIEIGRSATEIVARLDLALDGDTDRPVPLSLTSTVKDWFDHPIVGPLLLEGMLSAATDEQRAAAAEGMQALKMVESMSMEQFARFPGVDIADETLTQLIALSQAAASDS